MAKNFKIIYILIFILFTGCSSTTYKANNYAPSGEVDKLKLLNKQLTAKLLDKNISQPKHITYKKKYIFPEGKKFTFSATDASVMKVLYIIAADVPMQVVIGNDVDKNLKMTLNLNNIPLEDALEIIMKNAGLFYHIENNVLYVKSLDTKQFDISFLNTSSNFTANLGGDVLGGSDEDGATSTLKSEFTIKYGTTNANVNKFDDLRASLNSLLSKDGTYTINVASSTLYVEDKYKNIHRIEQLLSDMKRKLSKQVLIEAKVLEVILNDTYNMGIDWQKVSNLTTASFSTLGLTSLKYDDSATAGDSFSATLDLLKQYGSIDTLSNPRIRVINGESAIISSGKIEPFWEKEVKYISTTTTSGTSTIPETSYNRRDVLDGISMGVTPYIKDNNKIVLNIVPVSTTIESTKTHPDGSTAPILSVKEAGTIIETKDGDIVIIGGLLSEKSASTDSMVPGFGEIPVAGNLFKKTQNSVQKRELVIFIKIKLIDNSPQEEEIHTEYIQVTSNNTTSVKQKEQKAKKYIIQTGELSSYPDEILLKKFKSLNRGYVTKEIKSNSETKYSLKSLPYDNKESAQKDLVKLKKLIDNVTIVQTTQK